MDRSAEVDGQIAALAAQLNGELASLTDAVRDRLATEVDQLGGDERLINLLGASVEANIDTALHVLQHGIDIGRIEAPSAAVEYAKRLAQHGVAVDALIRAYRLGQDTFLRRAFELLPFGDEELIAAVSQRLVALTFAYVDRVSQQVVAVYEEERERWLQNRDAVRAAHIRRLLGEDGIDIAATEKTLGYRLTGRNHAGVVLWFTEDKGLDSPVAVLETAVRQLAERIGCIARPLFVPCDATSGWAWLPVSGDVTEVNGEIVRSVTEDGDASLRAAVGRPAAGLDGFRATHRQAVQAQSVSLIAGREARTVVSFDETGPIALMCTDIAATRSWLIDTLGALAIDDAPHARMRETLRVFLSEGGSYAAAAGRLNLHKNSIQYRIRKAEDELGHPVREKRLHVELALNVCHWLGPAVLRPR
ncbi:PucR C-terminal helix-turn-helix domain-containing protein [Haloechinothrix alba]|uniref:PucR C-terminal helix-turn-helix domain-containing protein n=1 Tax=Haloechinothrix alba TaxID=664784 RepID=A0A238WTH4_9PSEU|nr:helix-turn-helix domain-containing protein [Haloechinothrix alba]SNR49840.1 PucR C-terminal helix-turn-helix domain-containing protein [Haloechinothrix alba]